MATTPAPADPRSRVSRQVAVALQSEFLDGTRLSIQRDAAGLWLQLPDAPRQRITAVRPAFPLSLGPEMLVFYRRPDDGAADEEIGIVRRLAELPPASQDLLAAEIERAYFVPAITEIVSVNEEFGIQTWRVVTDRGPRTFEITERSHLRMLEAFRVVIKDVDGNRYQIRDTRLLDRRSQQWLDLQM